MHPQEIFKDNQASKLGDAPVHPLLHRQLSVRLQFHSIFYHFMRYVLCLERLALRFIFSFLQFCSLVITSQIPSYFVWDRNMIHSNLEHIIEFFHAYLFAVVCSLSFRSYCHVQFQFQFVFSKSLGFCLVCCWNSLQFSCLSC